MACVCIEEEISAEREDKERYLPAQSAGVSAQDKASTSRWRLPLCLSDCGHRRLPVASSSFSLRLALARQAPPVTCPTVQERPHGSSA